MFLVTSLLSAQEESEDTVGKALSKISKTQWLDGASCYVFSICPCGNIVDQMQTLRYGYIAKHDSNPSNEWLEYWTWIEKLWGMQHVPRPSKSPKKIVKVLLDYGLKLVKHYICLSIFRAFSVEPYISRDQEVLPAMSWLHAWHVHLARNVPLCARDQSLGGKMAKMAWWGLGWPGEQKWRGKMWKVIESFKSNLVLGCNWKFPNWNWIMARNDLDLKRVYPSDFR